MLAEMGADVIKVEMGPNGDPSRSGPFQINGRSGYFVQHNRGKRDVCIDLKHPEGLAIAKDLVRQADVMVENFAPGVIGHLGLGFEVVKALNPGLVMCSISAFGQSGPLANEPGFDALGASYAGVVSMCGEEGGSPPSVQFRCSSRFSFSGRDLGVPAVLSTHRSDAARWEADAALFVA
jgi:crotonobetainyl-CoA:carnitine CoA-transferase CaiB-like acyl-CoA transferase